MTTRLGKSRIQTDIHLYADRNTSVCGFWVMRPLTAVRTMLEFVQARRAGMGCAKCANNEKY